jgi:hypothetical protein
MQKVEIGVSVARALSTRATIALVDSIAVVRSPDKLAASRPACSRTDREFASLSRSPTSRRSASATLAHANMSSNSLMRTSSMCVSGTCAAFVTTATLPAALVICIVALAHVLAASSRDLWSKPR